MNPHIGKGNAFLHPFGVDFPPQTLSDALTPQHPGKMEVLLHMENRIPPPLVGVATAALMWLAARYFAAANFAFGGQSIVAGVAAVCGLAIELVAVAAFIRARTTVNPLSPERAETLVVSGMYRFTRNPMYLGIALLLAGWGVWLGNLASIALLAMFILFITRFQIKPEEAALETKFGAQFRDYRKRVRRWL